MPPADFSKYPRDLIGYGRAPPDPRWPGGARVAVQFVVNYEEGGERNILHGDATSEAFLSDVLGAQPWPGQRHMNVESMYEYGSRAASAPGGCSSEKCRRPFPASPPRWRAIPGGRGDARSPMGGRQPRVEWIVIRTSGAEERAHLPGDPHPYADDRRTPARLVYRRNSVNTLKIVLDGAASLYSSDSYADDLPFGERTQGTAPDHPYTLDANDMRFINPQGFADGEAFFGYPGTPSTFYAEGERAPKMMSVGCIAGWWGGGRARTLAFSTTSPRARRVWSRPGLDIARRWHREHRALAANAPTVGCGIPPATVSRQASTPPTERLHRRAGRRPRAAPWVAEAVHGQRPFASLNALHGAMTAAVRAASADSASHCSRATPTSPAKAARAGR
jgi:peptidoglycan/xylan/chitin deacetylase (PgdA/CDA1 family)